MKKRALSLLLAVLLIVSLLPTMAFAAVPNTVSFQIRSSNGCTGTVSYKFNNQDSFSTAADGSVAVPEGAESITIKAVPDGEGKINQSQSGIFIGGNRSPFDFGPLQNDGYTYTLTEAEPAFQIEFDNNDGTGGGQQNPPAPETQNGDVLFRIGNAQDGVVEYSFNNTNWTQVTDNSVLNASDLSDVETIYIKATPNEGQRLDDYIDNDGISVNRVTVDGAASALEFTDNVASFTYSSATKTEVAVRFMGGGQDNPPAPAIENGDIRFAINKSETDTMEYSTDGSTWISVANNDVVKANALTGVSLIYIKAVPGEGRKLDDYVEGGISVNQVRVNGTPAALAFTDDVASFTYDNNAQIEVAVRFMNSNPGPGQDDGHIVKLQINNHDGANGSVQCKFDTQQNFTAYTAADKDDSGNILLEIPEGAKTVTFKAVPDGSFVLQDCTIRHDDQDIDQDKGYMDNVKGDGYTYTLPEDEKTIVFSANFGNELVMWKAVSWGGGNVEVKNGQVHAYAVHVGDKTYDENVKTADETNKLYPLSDITEVDIQTHNVSFLGTDLFISEKNDKEISIDFLFVPDYGYQVTDVRATEDSLLSQFAPGEEISTFRFTYIPNTNVHFIVEFTQTSDIINSKGSSIVSDAAIGNGGQAIDSGNLKMDIADVAPENVSEGLKNAVGETDAQYLDMTLSQVVSKAGENGNWENQLTELNGAIDVSLKVSGLDPNEECVIIREHTNGDGGTSYDEIPVTYNSETDTITFATDKFSTYALVKKSASGDHTHGTGTEAVTFSKAINTFDELQDLVTTGGSGYLANDITATAGLTVEANVDLCLNDKKLDLNGKGNITVSSGKTFNLYDCGTSGSITGGNANGNTAEEKNGGGVYVSGTFNMYGGSITGNKATSYGAGVYVNENATFSMTGDSVVSNNEGKQGAGVYSKGTFTMSGNSKITENTGTMGGGVGIGDGTFTMSESSEITANTGTGGTGVGGVYIQSGTFTMTGGSIGHNTGGYAGGVLANVDITLGGTAKITDNVKGGTISDGVLAGGTASNVYLQNDKYITLGTEDNAPKSGMLVGVTTQTAPTGENSVVFTGNCVIYTDKYFFSDNLNYCVRDVRSGADTRHLELSGKYDLWVNDVQVTVDNKNDVLGEADGDGATVTYDNTTKTLTLNGAKFANGNGVLDYKKGVRSSIDELTVVLKGHSEIGSYFGGSTGSADESKYSIGEGFDCGELLRFVGDGSLTIYDSQAGIRAGNVEFGTEDEPFAGKVTIIDCGYVEQPEPEPPCAISAIGSVTIYGGTFNLTSYTSNGIAAENININGCTEIKVKGAVNVEGVHAVNANTSLTIADTLEVINSTYTKNETKSLDPTDGNKNDGYVIIRPKAAPPVSFNITNGTPESDKETNHGYITIDKTTVSEGETVTITVNPAEGYKLKDDNLNVRKTVTVGSHGLPITLTQDTQDKTKYTFTMPAYNVTVTAEFEEKAITIADILPDDFPRLDDGFPEDTWTNENGIKIIIVEDGLTELFLSKIDFTSNYCITSKISETTLSKDGNNYSYSNSGVTVTFVMSDNELTNIVVQGLTGDYEEFNGTYKAPHIHSFSYSANANVITATCTDGCDKGYDTNPLTLTLTAPASFVYDGNARAFTFADGEAAAWTGAGLELPTITYYQKYSGEGWYTQLNEVPVNAGGDYMVEIVVNSKAAQVKFTIDKATPYINTNPAPSDIIFGKKLADSTLTGGFVQVSSTNSTEVAGLFEWKYPDTVPGINDSEVTEYDVTFTPTDTNNYNTVSCKVKIKVNHTHTPVLVNGQAATETASGWKDYYKCDCGALFEDENGTTPIENLDAWKAQGGNGYLPKLEHTHAPVLVEGTAATLQSAGHKSYYKCDCGKFFEDATGNVPIEDLAAWKAEGGRGYIAPLSPESYTVAFNMGGHGTAPANQTVNEGGKATKPASDPTADGWTFGGWYADATFNVVFDFDSAINANTTIYAKWTENPPTPAYIIIVGANSEWNKGTTAELLITSDAPFAKFDCVKVDGSTIATTNYTAEEGSTKITLASAYLETLSVGTHSIEIVSNDGSASTSFTVKAAVPPVPTSYTVTFNMNGHGTQVAAQTVESGSKATKPADPKASGYTFGGWYADATFSAKFDFNTAITANTTVYAKWTKNSVAPTDPTSPQTGDNSHMFLWIALLFVSGGALAGTAIYGKKRKRAE